MSVGALIAAAGKYEAMDEFRPLMRLGNSTLIQREIDTLRQVGVSPIVVVTGHEAESLERHLAHRGVICLRNDAYENGEMFDSVRIGLNYLKSRCGAILFIPADAPLFTAGTLEKILSSPAEIVIPEFQRKSGHPILIRKTLFAEILAYQGDFGLRGALEKSGGRTEKVKVEDPGIVMEIGSSEEYRSALDYEKEMIRARKLNYSVVLMMEKEDVFFDPAVAEFLLQIDEKGSMLAACKEMGMSYSKGWKKIKKAEESMGYPFLERKAGGADGGNSRLTPEGRDFLEAYLAMKADVERSANAFFHLYFQT